MDTRWLFAIAFASPFAAAQGCESDTGSAAGAAGATDSAISGDASGGSDASSGGSGIFRICGLSSVSGQACDVVDDYVECVRAACSSTLSKCFGPANASGDFTEGVCAEYASCATSAPDPCHNDCTADVACQACLEELVGCLQSSACELPVCDGSSQDGGMLSPDAGTGITGTCADLETCCASVADTNARDTCSQTLAAARARAGDSDCAVVYSSYKSAGICR